MKKFFAKRRLVGAVVLLTLAGCVNLEKSYPDRHYFVLDLEHELKPANPTGNGVLQVVGARVSPRYEQRSFTYRISDTGYETDFYNQFLVPPAPLITEEIRKGLTQSQLFRHVIASSSQIPPTHVLDSRVSALYGDFRETAAPKAVLAIEFFLSRDSPEKSAILLERRYVKSVPLDGRSAEALVRGWNRALREILTALVADIKSSGVAS